MTSFIFCIHNHQPVGNFPHVLDDAYGRAYLPFLEELSKHPAIKISLHTSGFLLDWFADEHPEYIEMLGAMVDRGQVEIMGGGYYEPILSIIPPADRVGQITSFSDRIEKLFGTRPRGIWLAERVWDPTLPSFLKEAGVEYVVVDDYHFIKSGLKPDELGGYYVTEDQGAPVKVFPGSERLRYLIPFEPVDSFEGYLKGFSTGKKGRAAIFADDGEKFGVWPGTAKWVYKERWLGKFLEKIEGSDGWLTPRTFSEYMDMEGPLGRVYLPTTSYMEMGGWALPPDASADYAALTEELKAWEDGERVKRFLHGGAWRNFLAKYPEADWMHKRMLGASRAVAAAAAGRKRKGAGEALRRLYMSQCNDAYWHGVFGGLYLPHLRTAVYENLIKAENAVGIKPSVESRDLDADTFDEVVVRTEKLSLFLSPERGGTLVELDWNPGAVNLFNTFSRWREGYHEKLKEAVFEKERGGGVGKSIHDSTPLKEKGLDRYLKFDRLRRSSLRDHFLGDDETVEAFRSSEYTDLGDFSNGSYAVEIKGKGVVLSRGGVVGGEGIVVRKEIVAGPSTFSVTYRVENAASGPVKARLAVELNLCLPGCNGPACSLSIGGHTVGLDASGEAGGVEAVELTDRFAGVKVGFSFKGPVTLWHFPVETVSLSEAGFERNYQGTCLVFLKPFSLGAGEGMDFAFTVAIGAV
ncbi:MAG: alpha-amylase/4-alpha-glucanotransferase domain-containing protein [Thermodesulfobacteriota bacterium]